MRANRNPICDEERISVPGVYRGYSLPIANGYQKSAIYVPVRDGCRLAVDIYRPTLNGAFFDGPLPTVVISTGYRRSFILKEDEMLRETFFSQFDTGDLVSWIAWGAKIVGRHMAQWFDPVEDMSPEEFRDWLLKKGSIYEFIMMHGYNFAVFDNRATGASFGKANALDHQTQGMDISDILDWIVDQEWSAPETGMMGASWLGLAQNAAMSCMPKNLKAVMPFVAGEDTFTPMYPGGLYNVGLMRQWYTLRDSNERYAEADVVDEDEDGALFRAAVAERLEPTDDPHWVLTIPTPDELEPMIDDYAQWSRNRYSENGRLFNRDLPDGRKGDWNLSHLDPVLANQTDIAYYGYGGIWDLCGYTMAMAYADLTVPRKMTLGPWHHVNYLGTEGEEALRWLDYQLKGIDNGIMDEPPVTYAVSHPDQEPKWYGAEAFPPSGISWKRLHGAAAGGDDPLRGVLGVEPARKAEGSLRFTVDYETTAGLESRQWGYFLGPYLSIAKLENYRDRILTFITPPLEADLEITGYPILKFQMAINSEEGAVFAYLQDVAPDGRAYYVSDGQLNLRDRKVSEPPFNYLGVPYHSILEKDRLPITPNALLDIEIGLCQSAWIVPEGHRLCLTILGADKDNFYQRKQDQAPDIVVYCNRERPLTLDLPVIERGTARGAELIPGAFANAADTARRAVAADKLSARILASLS